jgi:hypothetical protein
MERLLCFWTAFFVWYRRRLVIKLGNKFSRQLGNGAAK